MSAAPGPGGATVAPLTRRARLEELRSSGLATDTAWATASEAATLSSGLAIFYLVTTQLGPGGYGYFIGAQSLVSVLAMMSSAWVAMLLMQKVVRDRRPSTEVFPACLTLSVGAGAVATLGALALGSLLLPGLATSTLLLFALAEILGAGLLTLAAALLQASDDYRGSVVLRTGHLLLRLVAVVSLVLASELSLGSVALAYFLVSLVSGCSALVYVRHRFGIRLKPARPTAADTRTGLSYAGALVSFAVQEDADKILLVRLADPVTAGLYAAAYRAVQLAVVPIRALTNASHRRFLQNDPDALGEHRGRARRFTAVTGGYGLVAMIALIVLAPVLPRVLGEDYAGSSSMIMLLAPLVLCRALGLFGFNGLMGLRRNGVRLVIIGSAAVLNLILTVALVRVLSWQGAAVATLTSEVFFIVATWCALVRYQRRHDHAVQQRPERGSQDLAEAHDPAVRQRP